MGLSFVLVQFLSALSHAVLLFLIASGLSLVFGVTRIVNFAHGSFCMLGAYLTYSLCRTFLGSQFFYGALILAAAGMGLLGAGIEISLLRKVYKSHQLYQLLVTFALVLILADLVRLAWGPENLLGPEPPGLAGTVMVGAQQFPVFSIAVIVAGLAVSLALWLALHRTRWGLLVRAASQDREMVGILGVDTPWLFTSVFALAAALAGLAGGLLMPGKALSHMMGADLVVDAFGVVVLGGLGSVSGALLASVVVAVAEAFGALAVPQASAIIGPLIMAAALVVRPSGFLGQAEGPSDGQPKAPSQSATPPALSRGWRARSRLGLWVLTALALAALPCFGSHFWQFTVIEVLALGLFAASFQLLLRTGGLLSLGHAAAFGLGAYSVGVLMLRAQMPMLLAYLLAPIATAVFAGIVALICARVAGIYLAMLTLAVAQLLYATAQQWGSLTGGDDGLTQIWPGSWLANPVAYYYFAATVCAACSCFLLAFNRSALSLSLRAARDHAVRATALGINISLHRWLLFVVSWILAGVAGATLVLMRGSVFPGYFAIEKSVEPLIMVLLGGLEATGGALLGATVLKGTELLLARYADYWQLALGSLLLVLVLGFPSGLLSSRKRVDSGE
jgi:branched-chain amino acid transport system permease protein